MLWARLLAYVTGTVNQELLLRNEYLATENRILRGQIRGRLLLSDGEKVTLAEIAHRLGRMALEDVAATAKPALHGFRSGRVSPTPWTVWPWTLRMPPVIHSRHGVSSQNKVNSNIHTVGPQASWNSSQSETSS